MKDDQESSTSLNLEFAEAERAAHEAERYLVEADLERQRRYQERFVFERIFGGLNKWK